MCDLIAKDVEGKDLSHRTLIISHVSLPRESKYDCRQSTREVQLRQHYHFESQRAQLLYASGGGVIVSYDK